MTAPDTGRWAQLTYTSFDRNDGRGGGWQVKDVIGTLLDEDQRILCGRIATQLEPGVEMPKFPTPLEIAELPHQMVHAPVRLQDGEYWTTWHTAPAGFDASGRPGNVFAHVLVDRDPDPTDGIRPIERWRSPDWLIPFGPEAVLASRLEPGAPGRGYTDRHTVASWLFAPRQWRTNTLAGILDALSAHRDGGKPVVLGAEDVDEAANWIAAVSLCTSVGAASTIAFSTLERASGLRHAVGYGVEIICVPRVDLPTLRHEESVVVIDTAEHLDVGDLGGVHRTTRGDEIAVTSWSAMILELFSDPETMVKRVADLDDAAASVGDSGIHPAWPAALVVSRDEQSDLRQEAMEIVTGHAPEGLKGSTLYDDVAGRLATDVGSTAEAWQHVVLQGAHDDEPEANLALAEAAVATYAGRALDDATWLGERGPGRLPARHLRPAECDPAWTSALTKQLYNEDPVVLLHALELGLRLGIDRDRTVEQLGKDAASRLASRLADPTAGPQLAAAVESVAVETRHLLWGALATVPAIANLERPPGALVPPEVTALLGPDASEEDPFTGYDPSTIHAQPRQRVVNPLMAELAFGAIRAGRDSENARLTAAWAQLEAGGVDPEGRPLDHATVSPFMDPPMTAAHMLTFLRRFGPAIPAAWHLPHLFGAAWDPTWQQVWQQLISQPDATMAHLASIRLDRGQPLGPPMIVAGQAEALAWAATVHPVTDPDALHRAHLVLATALMQGVPVQIPESLEQVDGFSDAEVEMISRASVRLERVVEVFAARTQGSPLFKVPARRDSARQDPARQEIASTENRSDGWLFGLHATDRDVPLVVAVLQHQAERNPDGILTAARGITGLADRETKALERWLNGWLRHERRREGR